MKYLISSVTIGACLLLSSAGDVFAQNPHPPGTNGPLGTGFLGVAGCGGTATVTPQPSPPGQRLNMTTHSPFPTNNGVTGTPNPPTTNTPSAASTYNPNSQYDNACLHQAP
jgi:hypothetical protein